MWLRMGEQQPLEPERSTADEDLPQDPGIPGGPPAPESEREGGMQEPDSPPDPKGIDAPDSPSEPSPIH
jgi:hypothetical protein